MNITEIATLASKSKKPNKQAAFDKLIELCETYDISATDAAPLYSYFMPPIPATPKTPEQWVAKARGKKDVRFYLNFMYSDGNNLIATDGHRLHMIPTNLEQGYYDDQINKLDDQGRFPDVSVFFVDGKDRIINIKRMEVSLYKGLEVYLFPEDLKVNKRYVDEMRGDATHFLCKIINDRVIAELPGNRSAVVMGVR